MRLLSEARLTAEESTQDESDFIEVRNKRKRFRKQPQSKKVRPTIVSIDPRNSKIQFAREIKFCSRQDKANERIEEQYRFLYSIRGPCF